MYHNIIEVSKSLFPSEVLLKTAYSFLDRYYIHFDETDLHWTVSVSAKNGETDPEHFRMEFENELTAQSVRFLVSNKTARLREMLLARAVTSTLIDEEDPIEKIRADQQDVTDEELEHIFTDWFDENV